MEQVVRGNGIWSHFQGRFGQLTDSLTGEVDATPYFTFRRNPVNNNEIQVVVQQNLRNDPDVAREYRVCWIDWNSMLLGLI